MKETLDDIVPLRFYQSNVGFLLSDKRNYIDLVGTRGGVVVKAIRYKPAGRGFDSR